PGAASCSCAAHQRLQRLQRGRRSLSCFQCSWLAEQQVNTKLEKEFARRWEKAYGHVEHAIDNPFKPPLLGKDAFSEPPTRADLASSRCGNCTKADGACARWTFYGNTGQPVNVTWMCVNSLATGCFVEHMANQFVKEVCLCADRHHCNVGSKVAVLSLAAVLFWATSSAFAWTLLS
ncbi:uncharacterized protein LOC144129832, partial [Amblyomma americanum]